MKNIKILSQIKLAPYTTFKIGGPAKYFFVARSTCGLIEALNWAKKKKLKHFILGGGSNLLISDKGFNGLVIRPELKKMKVSKNVIVIGSGRSLASLVGYSLEKGLTGLEWAIGIPGTVGGAIRGNAGSFGQSMAQNIRKVFVLHNLKLEEWSIEKCQFAYRESIFKKNLFLIVLGAEIILRKGDPLKIKQQAQDFLVKRQNQPKEPSAGCIFKNQDLSSKHAFLLKKYPELVEISKNGFIPTAWLIDRCGLKGKQIGQAQISPRHANFIVNLGGATAKDVKDLIKLVKESVWQNFRIKLEEEVHLV